MQHEGVLTHVLRHTIARSSPAMVCANMCADMCLDMRIGMCIDMYYLHPKTHARGALHVSTMVGTGTPKSLIPGL